MPDEPKQPSPRLMLWLIMGGLAFWAIYIAVGAILYHRSIVQSLILLAFTAMFIGFWLLLLRTQKRNRKEPD